MLHPKTLQKILLKEIFYSCWDTVVAQLQLSESLLKRISQNEYISSILNLSCQNLNDNHIQLLAKALKNNTTITTLVLYRNDITNTGALTISELLLTNKNISILDLNGNKIGAQGATHLAEALKSNKVVTALFLSENQIGDSGAAAIGDMLTYNSSLKMLNLKRNKIKDAGLKGLTEALERNCSLIGLNISNNYFDMGGAKLLAECLNNNRTLKLLNIGACFFGLNGAIKIVVDQIKQKRQMEHLCLEASEIKGEDQVSVANLLRSNFIEELDLSRSQLGETGAIVITKALQDNSTLKRLDLEGNNISFGKFNGEKVSEVADILIQHPLINNINIRGNYISKDAGNALIRAVEQNNNIVSLDVAGNFVDDAGEIPKKIKELLNKNKERVNQAAKYVVDQFGSLQSLPTNVDLKILKFYQACDQELLDSYLKKESYELVTKNLNRYLATNFLDLTHCRGNGKSTIEQLSAQLHFRIFSYLELDKILLLSDIHRCKKVGYPPEKSEQATNSCNMW